MGPGGQDIRTLAWRGLVLFEQRELRIEYIQISNMTQTIEM